MSAYDIVLKSREKGRPTAVRYISEIVENFIELHGDRRFADDRAIIAGIGTISGRPVTVIGIEKGEDTNGRIEHNFGCAHPEGYRKAVRLMKQAEKFHRPVLCFVDTSGAYCGIGAEERGQSEAIASSILEMIRLKTPTLSVIIGEGGSGGALGLCAADEVWIDENATYSVISPEGCASILWKDSAKVAEASECLKLTADNLQKLGAVERVLPENGFGEEFFAKLKEDIAAFFAEKSQIPAETLIEKRYERFRKF
ncbi:MAG TPA: hypothetical protein H9731_07450 [Candidatus Borkfalkia excrementipullorum]|nr:hypothetical protein [Candidatus Borkfalkia excrementipullorum]